MRTRPRPRILSTDHELPTVVRMEIAEMAARCGPDERVGAYAFMAKNAATGVITNVIVLPPDLYARARAAGYEPLEGYV